MREAVAKSIATGDAYNIEYRITRPDGQLAWVRVMGAVKYGADGSASSMAGISQEITDMMLTRRRVELLEFLDLHVFGGDIDASKEAYRVAEALGRALDVSRVGYGAIDMHEETATIERDWSAPGFRTLAGTHRFRDFGSFIEDLQRGETVVFADARADPRTCDTCRQGVSLANDRLLRRSGGELDYRHTSRLRLGKHDVRCCH